MSYIVRIGESEYLAYYDSPYFNATIIEKAKRWKTRQGAENAIKASKKIAPDLPYKIQEVTDASEKPNPWQLVKKKTHRGRHFALSDSKSRRAM